MYSENHIQTYPGISDDKKKDVSVGEDLRKNVSEKPIAHVPSKLGLSLRTELLIGHQ